MNDMLLFNIFISIVSHSTRIVVISFLTLLKPAIVQDHSRPVCNTNVTVEIIAYQYLSIRSAYSNDVNAICKIATVA
jgi:hypothetical protein